MTELSKGEPTTCTEMAEALQKMRLEISERKAGEEALREREERFRSLVEMSTDFVWEIDTNGVFTYASPAAKKLLGYEPSEVLGKCALDFIVGNDATRVRASVLEKICRGEPFWAIENTCFHKDGHPVTLETCGTPVVNRQKMLVGYRGVDRDITERKKIEAGEKELIRVQARAEAEKAKAAQLTRAYHDLKEMQDRLIRSEKLAALGKLAGALAHELRNPLGCIQCASYLLVKEVSHLHDEKVDKLLATLAKEIKAADRIINDVLTFGRQQKTSLSPIDVNAAILQGMDQVTFPSNIEVVKKLDDELPRIPANEAQIQHVVINLATNAVQAMQLGGVLKVSSSTEGNVIRIDVSDTGSGIPEENLKKIFEPLFSTKDAGVGLGLAICQSLISANGGSIKAKSKLGEGAVFTIRLPIVKRG